MKEIDTSLFVEIDCPNDEEDFLLSNPCSCSDQAWSLKERTLVLQKDGREYFVRKVFCNICGSSDEFHFTAPENAFMADEEDDDPREMHYLFAHRVVPEIFFEDAEGFVTVLKDAHAAERLLALWKHYDNENTKDGGESISPSGLQLEMVNIKSWEGVVITMPEAKFTIEACFIACMLSEDAMQYRYFVYELTFSDEQMSGNWKRAVLCEWLPGKRRRNFERKGPVTKEAFLNLVEEQLDNEVLRLKVGAKSVSVPTWDMVEEDDPSLTYFGNEAYRRHICVFAFHIVPHLFKDWDIDLSNKYALNNILEEAWEQLGKICEEDGYSNISFKEMSFEILQHKDEKLLLIRFPTPLSPPEPHFFALKLRDCSKFYFLEKSTATQESALFTSISEGSHGINGQIHHSDENAFLEAIYGKYERDDFMSTLQHLTYYAEINSIYEGIFGKEQ